MSGGAQNAMGGASQADSQGVLLGGLEAPQARAAAGRASSRRAASVAPVARVVLDLPLPHLNKPFDYEVPAEFDELARPGVRCTVRLAGQRASGFIIERVETSEHSGLRPLLNVPSGLAVLTPPVLAAAREIAATHAGTLSDVLRLAVPPRHAATEKSVLAKLGEDWRPGAGGGVDTADPGAADEHGVADVAAPLAAPVAAPEVGPWALYRGGPALLARLAAGQAPRAVWTALPAAEERAAWPSALAVAAVTTLAGGQGSLLIVPDYRDVDRLLAQLNRLGVGPLVARLTADQGPAARYRAFVRTLLGQARIVVGTRAAAFAPVDNLGLVACWDDGDDLYREPRAPYPNTRDILRVRAEQAHAAAIFGAHARSVAVEQWLAEGWARPVQADRAIVRERAPRVVVAGDDDWRDPVARAARIPSLALRTAREALTDAPVLVQVPHKGYVQALACQTCRTPARCPQCETPLALTGHSQAPTCRRCGWGTAVNAGPWRCRHCSGPRLRAVRIGSARTGEEIGRALPGVPVRVSSSDGAVLSSVPQEPAVVVATPGAEPWVEGGYGAALLLDGWVPLTRPELDASAEAVRRWLGAACLVRPTGQVVLMADAALAPVQALVRWDPAGFAGRDLSERTELDLPPVGVLAEAWGSGVAEFLRVLRLPPHVRQLGPVPTSRAGAEPAELRVLFRAPAAQRRELAAALAAARGVLSASKSATPPRVRMDAQSA